MSLDKEKIRASFEIVKPIAVEAVTHFYETLFSTFPQSRELFGKVDMDKQRRALIQSLVRIVDGLDDLESLQTYLRAMGSRHVRYGVKEEHYAMVGKSLLSTFRHFFKENWTSELEDQWILAIGFIADQMLEGAKTVTVAQNRQADLSAHQRASKVDTNDLPQVVRRIAREILYKALEDEMDGDFMKAARKKAAVVLSTAVREEADAVLAQFHSGQSKKVA